MKLYKHFRLKKGKYIDDDGNELDTNYIVSRSHYIQEDFGFVEVDYAASVRPVVVLPSESAIRQLFRAKSNCYADTGRFANDGIYTEGEVIQAMTENAVIDFIRHLNPDLTFTEPIPHGLEPELPAKCFKCGGKMVIVRPGEWQCEKCGY